MTTPEATEVGQLIQSILTGLARMQDRPPVVLGAVAALAEIDGLVWAMVEKEVHARDRSKYAQMSDADVLAELGEDEEAESMRVEIGENF